MSKILRCGDPHVRPDNIEESERLLEFILQMARNFNVASVEFMGDMFHTHAVIRMEVLDFWKRWVRTLSKEFHVVALAGNHDQPGDRQREQLMNAVNFLEEKDIQFTVVNRPIKMGDILYIPYMSDEKAFSEAVREHSGDAKFLVCHQTFNGSRLENGIYAPEGFDVGIVGRFEAVICGHIHKQQQFSNIFYMGTPRWDTLADANETKGIWLFENDEATIIPTDSVCSPIVSVRIVEGEPEPDRQPPANARVFVELVGSTPWITSRSKDFPTWRVIPRPTDSKNRRETNAQKLETFDSYAKEFKFDPNVDPEKVIAYLKGQK